MSCDVNNKIIEVKHNTRRKRKATTQIFITQKQLKKMIDRKKVFVHHSKNEWIPINDDVKHKIIEVKHNTRRKRKATANIFVTQK